MDRDLLPLTLLAVGEEQSVNGITRFQKLIFLAQKELEDLPDLYEFRADKYGPFSRGLYDDIDELVEKGYAELDTESTRLGEDKKVYRLTEKGEDKLKSELMSEDFEFRITNLGDLMDEYEDKGLWPLLKYVYREYPSMAEESTLNIGLGT